MGQQQMLLIVLGVVVVGLAVYGGMRRVEVQNQDQARDQIMLQMNVLAGRVEAYMLRPKTLGGGGGSATGFKLTKAEAKNPVGTFTCTVTTTKKGIVTASFVGTGTVRGNNGKANVKVTGKYTKPKLTMTINN